MRRVSKVLPLSWSAHFQDSLPSSTSQGTYLGISLSMDREPCPDSPILLFNFAHLSNFWALHNLLRLSAHSCNWYHDGSRGRAPHSIIDVDLFMRLNCLTVSL